MKAKKWILPLIIIILASALLACFIIIQNKHQDSEMISKPYEYPVNPGTDEWNKLTIEEKRQLTYVDRETAEKMTTNAILITTLNYPFIIDIHAFSDIEEGIETVKERFPPLDILISRDDATTVISDYLINSDTESIQYGVADSIQNYIYSVQKK